MPVRPRAAMSRRILVAALAAASVSGGIGVVSAPAAQPRPVLGIKGLMLNGSGWGTSRPSTIFNGGSPGGLATKISWRSWGATSARGTGRIAAFRPEGGYYRRLAVIQLRASRLGTCPRAPGRRAYTRLVSRSQVRPGGPFGDWHPWTLSLCDANAEPQDCGSVGFEPSTDSGAFEIKAFDTGCSTAQAVAGATRAVAFKPNGSRGYATYRLRTNGFVCNGSSFDDGLPSITFDCVRNTAVVTFKKS